MMTIVKIFIYLAYALQQLLFNVPLFRFKNRIIICLNQHFIFLQVINASSL